MEDKALQEYLDAIHDQLLKARDSAEAGLELLNKFELDLLRERATRSEKKDGENHEASELTDF
jgi:hypothetical protein